MIAVFKETPLINEKINIYPFVAISVFKNSNCLCSANLQ